VFLQMCPFLSTAGQCCRHCEGCDGIPTGAAGQHRTGAALPHAAAGEPPPHSAGLFAPAQTLQFDAHSQPWGACTFAGRK
jgi:hypothetical protein